MDISTSFVVGVSYLPDGDAIRALEDCGVELY